MTINMTAPYGALTNLPDTSTRKAEDEARTDSPRIVLVSTFRTADTYGPIAIVERAIDPAWGSPARLAFDQVDRQIA